MKIVLNFLTMATLAVFSISSAVAAKFDHSHALFDKVLERFVKDALVDYAALKADRKI